MARKVTKNEDVYIEIGPILDHADGVTPLDTITDVTLITGVITRSYDDGTTVAHTAFNPSATATNDWGMAAVGHAGMWILKVPDSEINFNAHARVVLIDADVMCPVWEDLIVGDAVTVDAEYGNDLLDVNCAQWLGTVAHAATVGGVPVVQLHENGGAGGINAPLNFEDLSIVDTTGLVTTAATQHVIVDSGTVTTVTNQLTAAAIATGVWQDAAAGDFTVAHSAGKALYIDDVVPGGTTGHAIVGSAMTGTMAVSDKTGFSLASTGLDAIPVANPTGVADTFPKMLVALWRHFFKKADFTRASGAKKTYADNGTTVVTTQTCTDADGVQTQGTAT
jgi:hypothetical protein